MDPSENPQPAHLPEPSYWPIVLAFSLVLMAIGVIFSLIISAIGLVVLLTAIVGWTLENRPVLSHQVAQAGGDERHGER